VSDPALLPLRWRVREPPLEAAAAAATGEAARALAERLLALPDERLAALSGVAGAEVLVVTGEDLPWVDGVQYLGRDPEAPGLLLPTTLSPAVPLPLVERAVMLRRRTPVTPMAVVLEPPLLVPLDGARKVDRAVLRQWLSGEEDAA
jgi:MoxR-vWA-beta-propeller ternary system protein